MKNGMIQRLIFEVGQRMPNGILILGLMGLTVILNTLAQVFLKLGTGQPSPINLYVAGGLGLYGVSALMYIVILGRLNLSFVYPIMIGLTMITTIFSGILILNERVAVGQWVGVGLMLSGLAAIALNQGSSSPLKP
jgi:small multidrug resistance pump